MNIFLKDTISSILYKLGTVFISLFIGIAIARLLGPQGRGEYALILVNITLLSLIFNLGVPEASIKEYSNENSEVLHVFINNFYLSVSSFLIVSTILYFLNNYLITIVAPEIYFIVVLLAFIESYLSHFRHYCLGRKKIHLYNMNFILQNATFLILIIIFLLLKQVTLNVVILGYVCGQIVAVGYSFLILRKQKIVSDNFKLNFKYINKIFKISYRFLFVAILALLAQRISYFYIVKKLDTYQLGIFNISEVFPNLLATVLSQFTLILYPYVAAAKKDESINLIKFVLQLAFLLSVLAIIILYPLGNLLITSIYGKEYIDSYLPMMILLVWALLLNMNGAIVNYFAGMGETSIMIISSFLNVLTLVILLNIPFVYNYGLSGVATCMIVSSFVPFVYLVIKVSNEESFDWKSIFNLRHLVKSFKNKSINE